MDDRALDPDDVVEFRISASDLVGLSRRGIEDARWVLPELIGALEGQADPPDWSFTKPDYESQTGSEEVDGVIWVTGFDGGDADRYLNYFAHMVRAYAWTSDSRTDEHLRILHDLGEAQLRDISTQDLWDALFMNARSSRFGDGPFDGPSGAVTRVSNEVLRRVIQAIKRGSRIDLTVD
jgi:hypothetical protein